MFHDRSGRSPYFDRIAGSHHSHLRKSSQNGNVFGRMVSHAQGPIRVSSTYRHDLHIRFVVADVVPHLLDTAQDGEVRNGIRKHDLPAMRDTGCNSSQVLLRDSDVEKAFRELASEGLYHAESDVRHNQKDSVVDFTHLHQGLEKC